jgi:anti-anti-sigma factor
VTDSFATDVRRLDGTVEIAIRGDVDLASAPRLWATLERTVSTGDRLVLDVSNVEFMDSSGLGVLVRAHRLVGGGEGLVIRRPTRQALRLFEAAGLDSMLTVEP